MSELNSFRDIVDLWPTRSSLAEDLGHPNSENVRKWWQRNNIPADSWRPLVKLGRAIEAGVTLDVLARLAARAREVA